MKRPQRCLSRDYLDRNRHYFFDMSKARFLVQCFLEKKKEKVWNGPKTVVTLHRQKEQNKSLRQKEIEIKKLNINN